MAKKPETKVSKCAITKGQFRKGAKPMRASINGVETVANVKEFASGTLGWFANGSTVVEIDGVPVKVTFQIQAFVANSKDAAE